MKLLRQAADLEPDDTRRCEIWLEIAQASAIMYDGRAFLEAMDRALELGAPPGVVYAEMAYADVQRGAMWNPGIGDLATEWVAKALAASEEGTVEHAKALVADASRNDRPESARRAIAWADEAGDDYIRSAALFTLADACYWIGDLEAMDAAVRENLAMVPRITDPDRRANIYVHAAEKPAVFGRFRECLDAAERLAETTAPLTPHHRVHGIGTRVGLRADMGRWEEICRLMPEAEATVDANAATPCAVNLGALLCGALAFAIQGDEAEARRLEAKADGLDIRGYDEPLIWSRVQLATAYGDVDRVRTLIAGIQAAWLNDHWMRIALLDGLIATGELDRIEAVAADWIIPGTYLEPFVLRSLGVARGDTTLIEQAVSRFEAMEIPWYADQTRKLLSDPPFQARSR